MHRFTVTPSTLISDFLTNSLSKVYQDIENYFLVYTGRELQPYNTFALELVEDQSEILAIHKV